MSLGLIPKISIPSKRSEDHDIEMAFSLQFQKAAYDSVVSTAAPGTIQIPNTIINCEN